jgi:hypothetical protein
MVMINRLIFVTGLSIALLSAMKSPATLRLLPDTVLFYAFGLTLAVVGAALLWREQWQKNNRIAQRLAATANHDGGLHNLIQTLQQLPPATADNLPQLQATLDYLHTEHIIPFQNLQPFFDQQDPVQSLYIITHFARGERLFNRVVSATLEAHTEEVNAVLPSVITAFEQAQTQVHALFTE